ncbi:sarcosine oxidase, monomeric form [Ancylostoma ceylanicum]|uniref:Sarcosine oxidase, monomeric form n=1 Tax=Ancylostoma ceylanicum TaxID=53326 RepID=A0A0D6LMS1_9BILA|nr:sarcosine oxidase, monomeric form [Ancylostoma ceylanicum]
MQYSDLNNAGNFELFHKLGSSHGQSRIIRYAHTEREYVPLVNDSYEQIAYLEQKTGEKLWKQTGLLWVSTVAEIDSISDILRSFDIDHEKIEGKEVAGRFPQFTFNDSKWAALIDPKGGVLYADKWLRTFQDEFIKLGGKIAENEQVLSYRETSDQLVELQTSKNLLHSKKAIFTVGPWIRNVFPRAPLNIQPESIAVCYWKATRPEDTPLLDANKFPVFIISGDSGLPFGFYGLPSIDYEGCAKVKKFLDLPAELIKNHIPIIDATHPAHVDKCKYTVSEDNHYVIGYYPGTKNVLVGGCGSGSGFKVAPGIGKVLSEMAADEKTSIDVSFFSFDRFAKTS